MEKETIAFLSDARALGYSPPHCTLHDAANEFDLTPEAYHVAKLGGWSAEEVELRKFARYFRVFTVLLRWTSRTGRPMHCEGLTRDISAGGMFILASKSASAGSTLHYDVYIRALHRMGSGLRISGVGQVVRVERMAESRRWSGFAVQFSEQMVRVAGVKATATLTLT